MIRLESKEIKLQSDFSSPPARFSSAHTSQRTPIVAEQPASAASSSSSSRKRTRANDNKPSGIFERRWKQGLPVWVHAYVEKEGNKREWVEGIVEKVFENTGELGQYYIVVNVKLDDGSGDEVIPRTINKHNCDPIPNICPGNSTYRIGDYIRVRDPSLQELSGIDSMHLHCLKYHCSENERGPLPRKLESLILATLRGPLLLIFEFLLIRARGSAVSREVGSLSREDS